MAPSAMSARQTVDRIAPEVLRHGKDSSIPLRRGDHPVAAADGEGQRFFAKRVQPQLEQFGGNAMVRPGIGRAIGCFQTFRLFGHRRQIGEDGRPVAEKIARFSDEVLRIAFVQVADSDEIHRAFAAPCQLGEPRQMPPPHAATTDDGQPNSLHESLLPYSYERTVIIGLQWLPQSRRFAPTVSC
jgi:hypothetical protein